MGGPLSRLLADLIIENKIEKKILQHPRWKKCWDSVRLIDDTLSGWESEEVFEFLNTLHPGIKWTCEKEQNGKLAIFDIQLIREGAKLNTTVYRKSSASDRYIHYTSWQAYAWKEKVGAIRTLKNRALTYCSNEELLADELVHLLDTQKRWCTEDCTKRRTEMGLHRKNIKMRKLKVQILSMYHFTAEQRSFLTFFRRNLAKQQYSRRR